MKGIVIDRFQYRTKCLQGMQVNKTKKKMGFQMSLSKSPGDGGSRTYKRFCTGRLCPEEYWTPTPSYTILIGKAALWFTIHGWIGPLSHNYSRKLRPFPKPLELKIWTILRENIKHYWQKCNQKIPKRQIFLSFHKLQLVKSLPFYIPEAWKKYPFRTAPPRIGH